MSYRIEKISYYLPAKIINNEYLSREAGIDSDFLETKIGIKERRIAAADESPSDMACQAGRQLFDQVPDIRPEIGLLILCTQNPDYRLPTTACLVQHRLGISTQCMAFDVNLGCSGFVYCLAVAGACLKDGLARKALLVMVDQYSRLIDPKDKNTAAVFGDAASCTLVGLVPDGSDGSDQDFGTDGSGALSLIARNSAVVQEPQQSSYLYMNGREVFKFSMSTVPNSVFRVLNRNKLRVSDIRFFVFHQANKYMLQELQKRMGIRDDQMIIDFALTGNTVSSTIPIALRHLLDRNILVKGDRLILCGFGVGLSWGTLLYTI